MNYLRISIAILLCMLFSCEENIVVLNSQERLQKRLEDFVDGKPQLAISAAIIKNGKLYSTVAGTSFDNVSFNNQRLFLAGSTTKMFTAALTIKWAEENEISLDSKVADYLILDTRFSKDITIRSLLNHTSGLPDYITDEFQNVILENPTYIFSQNELISFIPETSGSSNNEFQYSNTNYLLLGMLLEKWHSKELHIVMRQEIIDFLNLSQTLFFPYEPITNSIEHLWVDLDEDGNMDNLSELGFTPEALVSGAWASGGIVSTPSNMVTFIQSLFEGEILNENQWEEMQQFSEIIPDRYSYGLGLQKQIIEGEEWIGHDGSLLHYTMVYYHPATGSFVAIMANQEEYNFDNLLIEIRDIL